MIRPWQKLNAIAFAALALVLSAAPAHTPQLTAEQRAALTPITVPLVVGVYDGSALSPHELPPLLRQVNRIYAPANVRFTIFESAHGLDQHPSGGDPLWTRPDRENLRADRRGYLDHLFGRLRGVAINFTRQPKADKPATNGLAYGESGVVILRRHPTGLDKTAETLAHELAHTMGLTDLYGDTDATRLRYGYSSTRTDVTLTDDDILQIRAFAATRAGDAWLARAIGRSASTTAVTTVGHSEAETSTTTAAAR